MKRLLVTDDTHLSLIAALVDLEIHLIINNESTDEVKRLLSVIKSAKDVEVKE